MAVYRFQCAWQTDTTAPTDVAIITPHVKISVGGNAQTLCDDLATALDAWSVLKTQLTVKAYDAEATPSGPPIGQTVKNNGNILPAGVNRDVALVLSFWANPKRPRRMGRLYAPLYIMAMQPTAPNASSTMMTKVAALVPILTGLGGASTDWVVWSRTDRQAHSVTNWSVNNSFDTQRRRGGPPTASQSGTTSEAGFP
jgi:hypothetical protein